MKILKANTSSVLIHTGLFAFLLSFAIPFQSNLFFFVLIVIGVLSAFSNEKNISFDYKSPLFFPVGLYLTAIILAVLMSQDVHYSLSLSLPLIYTVFIFYLISENFSTENSISNLYLVLSLLVFIMALILIWQAWISLENHPSKWMAELDNALLVVPNDVVIFSVLAPFSLCLFILKPKSVTGILAVIAIILSITIFVLYQSRLSLLTMVVALAPMIVVLLPRFTLWGGVIFLALVLLIDANMDWLFLKKFITFGYSLDSRFPLWLAAWSMFNDHLFFGHGPHTFSLFYDSYLQHMAIPDWVTTDPRHTPWPHNLYLEALAEQGIIGALALGFLVLRSLTISWHLKKIASPQLEIPILALFSSFIGFAFAGLFELTLKRLWVLISLGILLGILAAFLSLISKESKF